MKSGPVRSYIVFLVLFLWPWLGRRFFGDRGAHNVLERPRDNPRRTAAFLAFLSWVFIVFGAGSTDRIYIVSQIPYEGQLWFFRAASVIAPFIVYFVTRRVCVQLRDSHPLRGWTGRVVRRTATGGFEEEPRR